MLSEMKTSFNILKLYTVPSAAGYSLYRSTDNQKIASATCRGYNTLFSQEKHAALLPSPASFQQKQNQEFHPLGEKG